MSKLSHSTTYTVYMAYCADDFAHIYAPDARIISEGLMLQDAVKLVHGPQPESPE